MAAYLSLITGVLRIAHDALGKAPSGMKLTHKAASRNTFANGALRAAIWACSQSPGLYNMENVLGLE